ncbi:MAG: LysR family transcriptional regulator, partial [Lachnospiraceae bacterium]|nr:LysR family transcriptional regulator [Lachnospiraceae bacterium]
MYDPRLQTFVTVAELGSFTAASKVLFISSVAVMKQIDAFETQVGAKLFVRTNHGIRLTPAGETILKEGKRIIKHCDDVMAKARLKEQPHTVITIGYTFSESDELTRDFWGSFVKQYPEYRIKIVKKEASWNGFRELSEMLGKGVDCIHAVAPPDIFLKHMVFEPFGTHNVCAVALQGTPISKKTFLRKDDLAGRNVIVPFMNDTITPTFLDRLKQLGCNPSLYQGSREGREDFLNEFSMTAAEDDITVSYPGHVLQYPSLVAIPAEFGVAIPFGLLYPPKASMSFKRFIQCAKKHMNSNWKS